ncbi:MAG TPA: Na+/H+ antiporter NhaA, partial [Gemmatimonadaceae bacterium]
MPTMEDPLTNQARADETPRAARRWFQRFLAPFEQFAQTGSLASVLLIAAMLVAMVWANSPWAATYFTLWNLKLAIGPATAPLALTLQH